MKKLEHVWLGSEYAWLLPFTAWKKSVFGVFLVRIFPSSDWIWRDKEYEIIETTLKWRCSKLKNRCINVVQRCFNVVSTSNIHVVPQRRNYDDPTLKCWLHKVSKWLKLIIWLNAKIRSGVFCWMKVAPRDMPGHLHLWVEFLIGKFLKNSIKCHHAINAAFFFFHQVLLSSGWGFLAKNAFRSRI